MKCIPYSPSNVVVIECKNCKGKGHVMNACALLPVLGWMLAIGERNDPRGLTRQTCQRCDGYGYIRIKTK